MRRKSSPFPLETARFPRAPRQVRETSPTRYGAALSKARSLGLFTVMAIAPLGALVGSVAACGGAAPVQAYPTPPVTTIEPPPAAPPAASSVAPTDPPRTE